MQTLTLDTLPSPVLLVWGLPEVPLLNTLTDFYNHKEYLMIFTDNDIVHFKHDADNTKIGTLPDGNWQLIGKLSELTEEQAQTIVFRSRIGKYKDYKPATVPKETDPIGLINALLEMSKETALESFHSAIEVEGYYVPSDKPMISDFGNYLNDEGVLSLEGYELYADALKEWQDAQSKTLPANTLIFLKK